MNHCSIWYRLVFVLNLCLQAFKSYGLLFRGMHEERKMMVGDSNYKQPYKSPCVSSMKLKRRIKDSLCYSESIYVHFRPNKPTLQELWTFACVMTSRKAVYNHCELENPLLLASRTSNAIVLWLRRFALLY